MRAIRIVLAVLSAVIFTVAGCSKKSSVDTSQLEKSFQSSEPAQKSNADKAVSAIKAGDYAGAMPALQSLARQAKLTPEQQQALKDVMAQVQKQMTEAAGKAAGEAQKAANDLKKSLPIGK
jgi:outer membrane protein assembly factor BamD (BamD/ComL family)